MASGRTWIVLALMASIAGCTNGDMGSDGGGGGSGGTGGSGGDGGSSIDAGFVAMKCDPTLQDSSLACPSAESKCTFFAPDATSTPMLGCIPPSPSPTGVDMPCMRITIGD